MIRALALVTAGFVGCASLPAGRPPLAPLPTPLNGMWAIFDDSIGRSKSGIGRSTMEQKFDPASLVTLRHVVAQKVGVDESSLAPARVAGCLGNNTAVQFPQLAGQYEIENAGALLNYSADNHLTYFRVHTVATPAEVTPPPLPDDPTMFVMRVIRGVIPIPEGATVIVEGVSDPFLYANEERAVWAVKATLTIADPAVSLPGKVNAVIDLLRERLLTVFDRAHAQTANEANVFLKTPLSLCTHAEYATVSASPHYDEKELLRLAPNAVTATGDYAIFLDLDPGGVRNPTWKCTEHGSTPGPCDFHYTWNGQPQQFAEVLTYFQITSVQLYVQSLGFQHLADRPINVDVLTKLGPKLAVYENNATGTGDLWFSEDQQHYNVARDPKLIVHEYGHALQAAVLRTRIDQGNEPQALSEGFADYLALSTFAESETPDCRQCLAAFMNKGNCYRMLNDVNKPVPPYNRANPTKNPQEVHQFGLIWTKALWLTLESVQAKQPLGSWDKARRIVDRGVLLGHCYTGYLSTSPLRMKEVALATLAAVKDDSFASPYLDDFCGGFTKQNILDPSDCAAIMNPPVLIP